MDVPGARRSLRLAAGGALVFSAPASSVLAGLADLPSGARWAIVELFSGPRLAVVMPAFEVCIQQHAVNWPRTSDESVHINMAAPRQNQPITQQ